jgi:hypothetical protein
MKTFLFTVTTPPQGRQRQPTVETVAVEAESDIMARLLVKSKPYWKDSKLDRITTEPDTIRLLKP